MIPSHRDSLPPSRHALSPTARLAGLWLLAAALGASSAHAQPAPLTAFSTGGHTVYHLRAATVAPGGARVILSASLDGAVLCHTPEGKLLWSAPTGGNMPFDLAAADIDGDGFDEALVASADGALYAIDHNGKPLWTFRRNAPLYQVAATRLKSGATVILAGGVEQVLYALDAAGKVVHTRSTEHCIRHIRAAASTPGGEPFVAVATASSGLNGYLSLMSIDPDGLKLVWERRGLGSFAPTSGKRFFSMELADLNHDARLDVLLSNGWHENGKIFGFDHSGRDLFIARDQRIPNVPYRMNLLQHVKIPGDEFVLGLYANVLIVYNLDGTCRQVLNARYDFSNAAFDPATRTYYLGSSPSGGDGVYALHLDRPGWQQAFETIKPVGTLAAIEENMRELERQIAAFQPPPYQPVPRPVTAIAQPPAGRAYRNVRFVDRITLSQKADGCAEVWCRERDKRLPYTMTPDEIVARVRQMEAAGQDFLIWAGHGLAAYMPLSTMERILEAAPKHLYGFEFAELEGVDDGMRELVEQIIYPLAQACTRHGGKKIVFRNKNIFYTGALYVPFWRKVLTDPGLRSVFVPALEETNSRTPELSLAGRVGLWLTGTFERWASRVVTDDACFDRMWEWSSQQVMSLHLRHLAGNAALGAETFFVSVFQGPFSGGLERQLAPFYDLVDKGIVRVPAREDLLSVSGLALGMKTPPSALYLSHGINGHRYSYPKDNHSPLVFDRLDSYWGAAPLLPHDFSRYAMNIRRRTPNFLPEYPYGLISILPDDTQLPAGRIRAKISTDGEFFYDATGKPRDAASHQASMRQALEEHAARLPVRVRGQVHWSAVRLDANHIRVTLIDPGYLDPADRDAEILAQGISATGCTDILRRESLPLSGGTVKLRVPAGTLRIVDLSHR
ncbi:MAG: PQQ-binding-like beta-propeller repeat protein [Bryobacterales bacterium]|nr:PQQ-binding-like beta-propeller repeat protein [Bryobacterales bacterium]